MSRSDILTVEKTSTDVHQPSMTKQSPSLEKRLKPKLLFHAEQVNHELSVEERLCHPIFVNMYRTLSMSAYCEMIQFLYGRQKNTTIRNNGKSTKTFICKCMLTKWISCFDWTVDFTKL